MERQFEKLRQRLIAEGTHPEKIPRWAFDAEGQLKVWLQDLKCAAGPELCGVQVSVFAGCPALRDISGLRGKSLKTVSLNGSAVLEEVVLPHGAKNTELLKRMPQLKHISYNISRNGPDKTATEFWKVFDAKKASR